MGKEEEIREYVEKVDALKKKNPKDLSSDQDLTIAIMNLISIEEHLIFSGAKTGKTGFYDTVQDIREMRKNLMQKIIPSYEGEVWCISKHLLATSMRLMEVGTKQQSMGNKGEAYQLFNQAYDLYCLFWGLNMNLIDVNNVTWKHDSLDKVQATTGSIKVIEKTIREAPLKKGGLQGLKDKKSVPVNQKATDNGMRDSVSGAGITQGSMAGVDETRDSGVAPGSDGAPGAGSNIADTHRSDSASAFMSDSGVPQNAGTGVDETRDSGAATDANTSVFSKLKSFVRHAVDCCIE